MNYIKQFMTKKNLLFIAVFALVGFIALQIPIAQLEGSKAKFTVYDAFAPVAGSFIGSVPGIIAVFLMQLSNFLVHGAHIADFGTVIRFFPMLFAVLGGGAVYQFILENKLLDEIFVTIEPFLFGRGKEMFVGGIRTTRVGLLSVRRLNQNGTLLLHYQINYQTT